MPCPVWDALYKYELINACRLLKLALCVCKLVESFRLQISLRRDCEKNQQLLDK